MTERIVLYSEAKPTVTRIIPELATEIGLNESIVLLQMFHWISISKNVRDGEYWTYQSVRGMRKDAFPYWSINTINRAISSLIGKGLIKDTDKYNEKRYDKTRWFTLVPDALAALTSIKIMVDSGDGAVSEWNRGSWVSQNGTHSNQNGTTIPEITTENTNTSLSLLSAGAENEASPEPPKPALVVETHAEVSPSGKETDAKSQDAGKEPPSKVPQKVSPLPRKVYRNSRVRGGQTRYTVDDKGYVPIMTFHDDYNAVFYAYLDALEQVGRRGDTNADDLWTQHKDPAVDLALAKRTPEQVIDYVVAMYKDPFWIDKATPIPLRNVASNLANWLKLTTSHETEQAELAKASGDYETRVPVPQPRSIEPKPRWDNSKGPNPNGSHSRRNPR